MLHPVAASPAGQSTGRADLTVGSLVLPRSGVPMSGTIVRYSGLPDMWFVQWIDGSCRLCRGSYLVAVPDRPLERVVIASGV